jgi:alkane 1-monooxygenase
MASASTTSDGAGPRPSALPYLLSLVLPLTATAFLIAPAHRWVAALGWAGSLVAIAVLDERGRPLRRDPPPTSSWALRALTGLLAAVQLGNIALLLFRAWAWGFSSDAVLAILMLGVNSAFSSMIVAHELIHRSGPASRWTGRMLLWTVLYDHFFTDHLRGHHRHVGTSADVLTARHGETFGAYLVRAWPGEVASAWRIEAERHRTKPSVLRWGANEFVRGALAQAVLVGGIGVGLGGAALVALIAQAALAHVITATVNYFEHWGIERQGRKVGTADSWDTTAPLSHHALLGLSFHADHHAHASHAFDRLELHADSPRLPRGYFGMIALVLLDNDKARALMAAELARLGLGPVAARPSLEKGGA